MNYTPDQIKTDSQQNDLEWPIIIDESLIDPDESETKVSAAPEQITPAAPDTRITDLDLLLGDLSNSTVVKPIEQTGPAVKPNRQNIIEQGIYYPKYHIGDLHVLVGLRFDSKSNLPQPGYTTNGVPDQIILADRLIIFPDLRPRELDNFYDPFDCWEDGEYIDLDKPAIIHRKLLVDIPQLAVNSLAVFVLMRDKTSRRAYRARSIDNPAVKINGEVDYLKQELIRWIESYWTTDPVDGSTIINRF